MKAFIIKRYGKKEKLHLTDWAEPTVNENEVLVQINAAEIDHPKQRRQILNDGKIDDVARPVLDRTQLDPRRTRRGRALHEKEFARSAIRISLHHHRAILKMR